MKRSLATALVGLTIASSFGCAGSVSSYAPKFVFDRAAPVAAVVPAHVVDDLGEKPDPLPRTHEDAPIPSETHLTNGVRVLFVERRGLPLVSASFLLRFDPRAAVTVMPELYANAMKGGSSEYSSQSTALFLAAAGVHPAAYRQSDTLVLHAQMLAPHAPSIFDRLSATIGAPSFESRDLQRGQRGLVAQRMNLRKNPSAMAAAQRMLLGESHPARIRTFDLAQIDAASRDALKLFEQAHLFPANLTVVVAGDFQRAELLRVLEKRLGQLRASKPANTNARAAWTEPAPPQRPRVAIVPWHGSTQSKIAVVFPGPSPTSADRVALRLLGEILSSSSGRLTMKIREEQGASYGVAAGVDGWRTGSAFEIGTSVETSRTSFAVDAIIRELERLRVEPIPDEELARAKGRVASREHGSGSPLAKDVSIMEQIALQDLPLDHFAREAARLDALTADDLKAAATKYLRADRMQIAVAADPAAVQGALRGLGLGEISIAPPM